MFPMSLFGHYQAQIHGAAASPLTKQTFRRSRAVVLLALSVPACFASGALAQEQERASPILSSGLREARSAEIPALERPGYLPPTQSPFDAASLPPIASIGAGSDIRPYLAPGVPQDLTRAALRRAWSTDPAIRDYIDPSENSWDFSAPDAVYGLGPSITGGAGGSSARLVEDSKNGKPGVSHQSAAPFNELGR